MEKYYSIAIRKRLNKDDRFFLHENFVFSEVKINSKGRYWFADPFLFEHKGILYIFYEAFDLLKRKGVLGYSILDEENNSASTPRIILEKKYHLSFPYIFKKNGEIYIMPETCGNDTLRLFKAVDFPNTWEDSTVLLKDVFVCDSIFMELQAKKYLLCSEQFRVTPDNKVVSCYVKNRLFNFEDSMIRNGCNSYGNITGVGENGIRNAGKTFELNGKTIRVGQNCENGNYGKGLNFFSIDSISPYSENCIYSIDYDEMQTHLEFQKRQRQIVGTHTYNANDNFEVIDFSYKRCLPAYIFCYRILFNLTKYCYRICKRILKVSKKIFARIKKKLFSNKNTGFYEAIVDEKAPWVFVSYISDPFYYSSCERYLNMHQNKREALQMARVFNGGGYNAYFMDCTSKQELPDRDFKLVFGHEPNFMRACKKYTRAKKIYYGVSTFYEYRNNKIKEMTDYLNQVLGCNMPYRRLVVPHDSVKVADGVLLIGSKYTIETFPEKYRNKITLIHQSTQQTRTVKFVEAADGKEFLFLASYGNALKGVAPLLEFFMNHQDCILHWVGPVEHEVKNAIMNKIPSNIRIYGFQDINSNLVLGIMERCNFIIYPSGVEGVPGSVLNAMKNGLIPLVTPWASFDDAEKLGFIMKDASVEGISDAVHWALSLSETEITERKRECVKFIDETYNLNRFSEEFETYMKKILRTECF